MGQGKKQSLFKETIMTNFSTVIRTICCVKAKIENPALSDVHGRSVECGVIPFEDLKKCAFTRLQLRVQGAEFENKWWLRSLTMEVGCYLIPQEKGEYGNIFLSSVFRPFPLGSGAKGKCIQESKMKAVMRKPFRRNLGLCYLIREAERLKNRHRKSVLKGQIISSLYLSKKREKWDISGRGKSHSY